MSKKIISLAVAVIMVVAMLPMSFVSASAADDGAVSYKFDNLSINVGGNTDAHTITDYSQTNNTWKFYQSTRSNAHQLKNTYMSGDTRDVDHYIALNINVPETGAYDLEYVYAKVAGRGGKGDVYIVPGATFASLDSAKESGTKIASVDYSGEVDSFNNKADILVDGIELSKGDNILLFVVTGKGDKATANGVLDYFTYPISLVLTPIETYSYNFDYASINAESGTQLQTITDYSQTNNTWKYYLASSNAKASKLLSSFINGDLRKADDFIALHINVPKTAVYKVDFSYYVYNGRGGKGDVYILKSDMIKNIPEAKQSGIKIASLDYSVGAVSQVEKADSLVENITLKKGTNILLLVATGAGDNATACEWFAYPSSFKLTLVEEIPEDAALTDAFKVTTEDLTDYAAPSVVSVTVDGKVIAAEKNADNSYNVEAPEENTAGEAFLYWAKGLNKDRRILSFSNKLENYVPDESGANILIAVYDGNGPETAEYYNANGQLIAKGEEPEKPSMAGYGTASDWAQYEDKNIYVAEYAVEEPAKDIEVTVINGDGTDTYAYGDTVTCIADTAKDNFKCWTKSDINGNTEIVSVDRTYSFKAWEKCTVTAIYEDYNYNGATAKIILDTFTAGKETAIMAEFIGFTDVIEKGIMCGTNKIAMTKPGNQFTVIADEATTYVGYAILQDGDGFAIVTDGFVKKD
ncbi:MAG: hypothetical protein IJO09_01330 [Oscillospiraceae bacterium]|nr:hypothetical protein [Oscillospiraceae bacterium]